jgi:hypothetical protein
MKMILHIMFKDLRRHWLELSGYLLACLLWAWREAHPMALDWVRQREYIPILLFGLWFLITIRLIQGESMVGDKEFWPTRPYRWPQLMAAKAFMLVLCLNLPLLAAQFYLLHDANIPITWALIPGLLALQGMFIVLFTFPTAVIASITASIVKWVLAVVGLILAILTLTWIPFDKLPPGLSGGEDVASWIGFAILVPAMLLVLVWQFARHRETPARWLFGLSLFAIPLCILLSSTPLVRNIAYPIAQPSSTVQPTQLQLAILDGPSAKREFQRSQRGPRPEISFPVADRAIDSDSIVQINGYRALISGPGWHWQSKWINHSGTLTHLLPAFEIALEVSPGVADKIAQGNATVKVEVAYETYRLDHPQTVDTKPGKFLVPGVGQCNWLNSTYLLPTQESCVAPLRMPPVWVTQIDSEDDACPLAKNEAPVPPGHVAQHIEFGTGMPADFDPNPVHNFVLAESPWIPAIPDPQSPNENRTASFCSGTRFTIRTGIPIDRQRAIFDLGNLGTQKPEEKSDPKPDNE